ncbi:MAG TPA: hypothetical protein VGC10_02360 [Sphingomonas sp.]
MELSAGSAGRFAGGIGEKPARAGRARFARRHALALIVGLGLAIRLMLLVTPRSYFPDEIFQYLEPAHRLVFGKGVVPWEYRYGIRSWLVPLALSAPMRLGAWIAPDGGGYLIAAKLALVLLSLLAIVAAAAIGARMSRPHACFAAFVVAIWSECALFATQALTETIAVSIFLAGAALLYERRDTPVRLAAAGALLALAIVIRFQYGPAIGLFALLACGRDLRRWLWLSAGGIVVLVACGAVDLAMGQAPYGWIVENFRQNIVHGRSHMWTDGPFFYPIAIAASWSLWLLPIWYCARLATQRYPALLACALANIAVHTLIAHKEYRYILLSTTIIVLLAAIGTVDAMDMLAARRGIARARLLGLAALGWVVASLTVTMLAYPARTWAMATPGLETFAYLRAQPKLCGVALTGTDWTDTGGYAYLHRDVPLYISDSPLGGAAWIRANGAGFDTVIAPIAEAGRMPAPYALDRCFTAGGRFAANTICVYRRPGPCDPATARRYEINTVLARVDR